MPLFRPKHRGTRRERRNLPFTEKEDFSTALEMTSFYNIIVPCRASFGGSVLDNARILSYNVFVFLRRTLFSHARTIRNFGLDVLLSILSLISGLGVLMIGMKMLSEGLERSAGKGMRKLFGKISDNRFAGVGVGAVATVLVNSSAATTVMVIGFVNAGLMTLVQATAIIMGANIGTTLTGIIVALSGFSLSGFMGVLAFIGVAVGMIPKTLP